MQIDNFGPMAKTALILSISNPSTPERIWQLVARNEPNKKQIVTLMRNFFRNIRNYSEASIGELKYVSMGGERKLYHCSVSRENIASELWVFTIERAPLVSFEKA